MSRNVHTLGNDDDKPSRRRSNSSDDENSDEGRQGFFVGGSDRSGQEVLGPNPRDNASEHLFEAIRRAGAERLTEEEALNTHQPSGTTGATAPMAFRLGGHGVGTEQVGGTSATTTTGSSARQQPVIVRLVFWTNGFTVDDGPLRQFQDPKNQIFLQAVLAKRIPPELTLAKPGREIDLRIEKKSKDYEEPKTKPFSGQGNQLGTITPHVSGAAGGDVVFVDAPPKLSDEETVKLVEQAQAELKVDDALPTTRIQIRIPDTVRPIVARLNQTQTVNQLRIFIVTADPTLAYRPFRLMTSYQGCAEPDKIRFRLNRRFRLLPKIRYD